jgi:hypothetical protein
LLLPAARSMVCRHRACSRSWRSISHRTSHTQPPINATRTIKPRIAILTFSLQYLALFALIAASVRLIKLARDFIFPPKHRNGLMRRA